MAIYHLSVKIISRGKGKSACAAAAYRAAEVIQNPWDGITHDFSHKTGVVASRIITPDSAPEWADNRVKLWQAAEVAETRKDARLGREIEIALPTELTLKQQRHLTEMFVIKNCVRKGMIADISYHDTGNGNPHAHIMLTDRPISKDGFTPQKNRDWNAKELVTTWRKNWQEAVNKELAEANILEHVSCETLKAQGINRLPTVHVGVFATALERKGISTERGNINRAIKTANAIYGGLSALAADARHEAILLSVEQQEPQAIIVTQKTEMTSKPEAEAAKKRKLEDHIEALKEKENEAWNIEDAGKTTDKRGEEARLEESAREAEAEKTAAPIEAEAVRVADWYESYSHEYVAALEPYKDTPAGKTIRAVIAAVSVALRDMPDDAPIPDMQVSQMWDISDGIDALAASRGRAKPYLDSDRGR